MSAVNAVTATHGEGAANRSLGVWACSALVVGNIVGSGFFLSPAALAPYGMVALIAWVVMTVGALALGLVFARLARLHPAAGGPFAFVRLAFGPLAGFLIAWSYWISIWASIPAIALALVGYLAIFFPVLKTSALAGGAVALGSMWTVAVINMRGVREAGLFQTVMVTLKLVPFLAIASIGLFWVDPDFLLPVNPSGQPFFAAFAATTPLIMFAFLGIESATVPAGDVKDPERTIPRATVLGTLLCGFIFVFGTLAVMGTVPREALVTSSAPFADAAGMMWGPWASTVVAVAVVVSSLGALNGWTLMMTQVPMAAARDGSFPRLFGRQNAHGAPVTGIVVSMGLASLLLILQSSGVETLIEVYNFVVDLATTSGVIPYVFCCLVEGALFMAARIARPRWRIGPFRPASLLAFVFSVATIYGSGPEADMWGLILLLLGLPFFVMIEENRADAAADQPAR